MAPSVSSRRTAALASRDVTLEDMQVGSANRLYYFDDRVRGRRNVRSWTLFQAILTRPPVDEGFHHPRWPIAEILCSAVCRLLSEMLRSRFAHCEFSLPYPQPKCGIGRAFPRRIRHNRRGSSQAEPRREQPYMNVLLLQRVL